MSQEAETIGMDKTDRSKATRSTKSHTRIARPTGWASAMRRALRITAAYILFGALWIFFSDTIVARQIQNPASLLDISIIKGVSYVLATAGLIFWLAYSAIKKLVTVQEASLTTNNELGIKNFKLMAEVEKSNKIEAQLLEAQRQAHIGSFEYCSVTGKVICTDEMLRITGLRREDFVGTPEELLELLTPEGRTAVQKLCSRALAEKCRVEYDCKIIRPDGGEHFGYLRFDPVFKDDFGNFCIVGTVQDITERKHTEDALKESERSKSLLISHLPGIAYRCLYDHEWTMVFISEGCYKLTGYKPESLLNNKEISFNELICPEYRMHCWAQWARVLPRQETFTYEYEITTASGERKWVWEMGQGVYDENGNVEALEGLIIDITDTKQKFFQIQYLNNHDTQTGMYNRHFYEEAKALLDTEENLPLAIIMMDINGVRLINNAFGRAIGDALIVNTAKLVSLACKPEAVLARTGGDEFTVILPNTDTDGAMEVCTEIKNACERYNAQLEDKALALNLTLGFGVKESADESIEEAEKDAETYMDKRKLLEKNSHHNTILTSIMATMFARSNETEEHARRIADICNLIGQKMGLPQTKLDELQLFSMLHDIGKIGVDDRILNKPGGLTPDEWVLMQKHTEIGYMLAMASPEFAPIADYILSHHERWDGAGYPRALKGEAIPLLSRILSVADAYDAMTQDRVYRKAISREDALEEIRRNTGTQFDPDIAATFIESI